MLICLLFNSRTSNWGPLVRQTGLVYWFEINFQLEMRRCWDFTYGSSREDVCRYSIEVQQFFFRVSTINFLAIKNSLTSSLSLSFTQLMMPSDCLLIINMSIALLCVLLCSIQSVWENQNQRCRNVLVFFLCAVRDRIEFNDFKLIISWWFFGFFADSALCVSHTRCAGQDT